MMDGLVSASAERLQPFPMAQALPTAGESHVRDEWVEDMRERAGRLGLGEYTLRAATS